MQRMEVAECVHKIYRIVTMIYYYNYHNSEHHHRPVFHLKHKVSEKGLYFLFQVEPTRLGPI
jgi:hypothetical protein